MSGPKLQNFSLPAGDDVEMTLDIGPDIVGAENDLTGCTILWQVFGQTYGVPDGAPPIISKSTGGNGITITGTDAQTAEMIVDRADTFGLLGNYYHEAKIVDGTDNEISVTYGILTITNIEINKGTP